MIRKIKDKVKQLLSSEIIRYGIAGGTVTATNALVYMLLLAVSVPYRVSNIISLVASKTLGYFLNKFFVYRSHSKNAKAFILELARFILARGFTGLLDYYGLVLLVEVLNTDKRIGKFIVMFVVIVLNYLLGKKLVFLKDKKSTADACGTEGTEMANEDITYNTGNYDKYMTKNPLKRKMVNRLNTLILNEVSASGRDIPDISVLDAGCGEGFISHLVHESHKSYKITGLEYTPEAIAIARDMNPDISFIQGDICSMPFEDSLFDTVLCTEVLEHLKTPAAAIKELIRTAGHTVIITVPHEPFFCMGNILALKNLKRFGNPVDHINHWTYFGFKRFIRSTVETIPEMKNADIRFTTSFPWSVAIIKLD